MASSSGASKNEEKIVLSNLPLLFTDGYPNSLDSISASKLEKFIPFMLDCSLNREGSCKEVMVAPVWWPSDVEFRIPLVKTTVTERKWQFMLKRLVYLCYRHHKKTYMLSFCEKLSKTPSSELKFVDLHDGTTSLHKRDTGKLLVTFKNENRTYDKKIVSPRKYLLPPREVPSVVEPTLLDIYLCDNCDAEFETLPEVRDHERVCQTPVEPLYTLPKAAPPAENLNRKRRSSSYHKRVGPSTSQQPFKTPKIEPPTEDLFSTDQSRFLNVFALGSDKHMGCFKPSLDGKYKSRCSGAINQRSSVPISSPLGLVLLRKHSLASKSQMQTHHLRIDQHCVPTKISSCKGWNRMYRNAKRKNSGWTHSYCFNKKQRQNRMRTITTGLDKKSRRLLRKCRLACIPLIRVSQSVIDEYKSRPILTIDGESVAKEINLPNSEVLIQSAIPPANMSKSEIPIEPAIRAMKSPTKEGSEAESYEVFYRPIKSPSNDKIRFYEVFYRPSNTPAGCTPHHLGLNFLYKSQKKPCREDVMALGKGAPQAIKALQSQSMKAPGTLAPVKEDQTPPIVEDCMPFSMGSQNSPVRVEKPVKEIPAIPTAQDKIPFVKVTPIVKPTIPSAKVTPTVHALTPSANIAPVQSTIPSAKVTGVVQAMKPSVKVAPTVQSIKPAPVKVIDTHINEDLIHSTFEAFMQYVKDNPNSPASVKKQVNVTPVTPTIQVMTALTHVTPLASPHVQSPKSTAKVTPIVQTVKTPTKITSPVITVWTSANFTQTPQTTITSPIVQVDAARRSVKITPRRSVKITPRRSVKFAADAKTNNFADTSVTEDFQDIGTSGLKTPPPTVESLTQSEKEVVLGCMRHAMSSKPDLGESENHYFGEKQMYESLVPSAQSNHSLEMIPVIDLCSDDEDEHTFCNSQLEYQNPANLPNLCLPTLQSQQQSKSSPGIKHSSATRTRWYERNPKATLTSENESMNSYPKRDKRAEKWILHKESGLHDQNRRVQ